MLTVTINSFEINMYILCKQHINYKDKPYGYIVVRQNQNGAFKNTR